MLYRQFFLLKNHSNFAIIIKHFFILSIVDVANNKKREIDIITDSEIIEVKSGLAKKKLNQLLEQKEYAKSINKLHVLYAPNIAKGTKQEYNKSGIIVATNITELISIIKGGRK